MYEVRELVFYVKKGDIECESAARHSGVEPRSESSWLIKPICVKLYGTWEHLAEA